MNMTPILYCHSHSHNRREEIQPKRGVDLVVKRAAFVSAYKIGHKPADFIGKNKNGNLDRPGLGAKRKLFSSWSSAALYLHVNIFEALKVKVK